MPSQDVLDTIKPSVFYDPTSCDTRRLSLNPPSPPMNFNTFHHSRLMLPSERLAELHAYKAALVSQEDFKKANALYTKQRRTLDRGLSSDGVAGLASPVNRPDPAFSRRASEISALQRRASVHASRRLSAFTCASAAPLRSRRIGAERLKDTHSAIWPKFEPSWTVARALEIYRHDTRDKTFNIISGATNTIEGLRVRRNQS